MTSYTPEEMVIRDAPLAVVGERQLYKLRRLHLNQQFDLVVNYPTSKEKLDSLPILDRQAYENIADVMKKKYDEKYEAYEADDYQIRHPYLYISSWRGADRDEVFSEVSLRAQEVLMSLKMNWLSDPDKTLPHTQITGEIPLLASLKEAFLRTQNLDVKSDIRRVYELLSYHLAYFDQSDILMECLIDSPQTPDYYQAVFMKLLFDEQKSYHDGKLVLDKVGEYRQKLAAHLSKIGLYFPLPKITDITYVGSIGSFKPIGTIFEREYDRVSASAIVKSSDAEKLDPQHLTFVANAPMYLDNSTNEEIEQRAVRFASTIFHESVHFNAHIQDHDSESGTWQESANELITDYTTLILATDASIGEGYLENDHIPADWFRKTGYHQLVKAAFRFESFGLATSSDMIKYGLNQDYSGFLKVLDKNLQGASSEQKQRFLDSLDAACIIGPDQYDELVNKSDIQSEDIFRAIMDFSKQLGGMYYTNPGTIFMTIKESEPEWNERTPVQFMGWFSGKGGEFGIADKETRHNLLRKLIREQREFIEKRKKI